MTQEKQNPQGIPAANALYLPALDGLRLLAFLLVFIHHLPEFESFALLKKIHTYGWFGVELFFSISAFLFFYLFKSEHALTGQIDIKRFYIRRLLRIYPLMVGFPVLMMVLYSGGFSSEHFLRFLGLALFSDNIITWFKSYNPIPFSNQLWTLSAEFQIYLIIPFAFIAAMRFGTKRFAAGVVGVSAFCLALRTIFEGLDAPHPIVWVTPFLHPDSILLGILLSLGLVSWVPIWACVLILVSASYSFLSLPVPWNGMQASALSYFSGSLACASLVILALRWRPLSALLTLKPFVFLGSISFGLYVYHRLGNHLALVLFSYLGWTAAPAASIQNWMLYASVSLLITTSIATLSFYALERPLLRLKDKFAVIHGR